MRQVFLSGVGQINVLEVPVPGRMRDSVLVRNAFSLISSGTEAAAVTHRSGLLGMVEKFKDSRDRMDQVWSLARTVGVKKTAEIIRGKLENHSPIGYSCAGQIVEVDGEDLPFAVGDRIACMGAGFASHAEYVVVPKNLAASLPPNVSFEEASFAAIGCIALEGIRRLGLTPGERVGVIGLGLIGQVCVRLLKAMGYRAIGLDLHSTRAAKAAEVEGVDAWSITSSDSLGRVVGLTEGHGLDGVVVCAATESDDPVNLAFDLCRKRGRVSVVGDVGLGLNREKMYRKELDLLISTSYGPGRYDANYEIEGRDYPFEHVRWTAKRNLQYFLRLVSSGQLSLIGLISFRHPIGDAREAYARLKRGDQETYGILIDYGAIPNDPPSAVLGARTIVKETPGVRTGIDRRIRVGLIGVGGYAKAVHVPNLKKLSRIARIHGVASRTGVSAVLVQRKTGARISTSDYRTLLEDPDIDAVVISTRHASHAGIVLDSLRAGKHVFVEKPMATTVEDARAIERAAAGNDLVVRVGFNRRFSPYLNRMRIGLGGEGIRMFSCRVNVGPLQNDWSNTREEGGRLLGEGVHFFDLCNWYMGEEPLSVSAVIAGEREVTNPNAMIQIDYPDGSAAQILYTVLGHGSMGKEYFEAFGNGRSARMDDYRHCRGYGTSNPSGWGSGGDKGQFRALEEFLTTLKGEKYPVQGADARAGLVATWMALAAYQSSARGERIRLDL